MNRKSSINTVFKHLCSAFLLALILHATLASAQTEIPVGTWRMHISYNAIQNIAIGNDKIFGATSNSIMILEKADNSINSYSKLNGLSSSGISFINYDDATNQLLIAYADGGLDLVKDNVVTNFTVLKDVNTITGSRKINHITLHAGGAYLATAYGVVVFDLKRAEVKETWRDLGVNGTKLEIFQTTFLNDSIFMATSNGVIAGSLTSNLLDYNNWKRYTQPPFNAGVQFICNFNNTVYAAINNKGIYKYQSGQWSIESFLQGVTFKSFNASADNLLIAENTHLWKLNQQEVLTQSADPHITQPLYAVQDNTGNLWIGDSANGLVSNSNGSFNSYLPNGPVSTSSFRLNFNNATLYNLPGGYSSTYLPLGNTGLIDQFQNGIWSTQTATVKDPTDIDFSTGTDQYYVSSFGGGVEERNSNGSLQIFNEQNSPLIKSTSGVYITALENSDNGLWVANYNSTTPLHLLSNGNTWQSFSFPVTAANYPLNLIVDLNQHVWMMLNPLQGGGIIVFDKANNKTAYLTDQPGHGGLPHIAVRSMAVDRDGYIWIGTDAGVAYFDSYDVFTSSVDAIKPIFESRYLLKSEKITALAVDGGNRKWIGTERGVWLFNPTGEQLIYNFTQDNSPLLSNVIQDIKINPETGEVFFATDKGIVSYRGDATQGSDSFQRLKIFPNPVTTAFTGTVGISGLATDAIVKITDVDGKLIWQTQANGGTANWNIHDYTGRRVTTGIYLVFAAAQDGSESIVGKIALIE